VPPSLLDSNPDEDLVERIAFLENRWDTLTREEICAECHGRVDGRIETGGRAADGYHYHGHCRRCGFQHGLPIGLLLVGHPAVIAFYHDRGIDVRTTPFWTLDFCAPGAETVVSTDPLRLRVDVDEDGDTLSLTLDREGAVVWTERSGPGTETEPPRDR